MHVQRYLSILFTYNVESRNTLAISTRLSTSLLHLRHSNNFVAMVSPQPKVVLDSLFLRSWFLFVHQCVPLPISL